MGASCREAMQVDSVIRPAVHLLEMTAVTHSETGYARRWLLESYMIGLKLTTGAALSARSERSLFIETALQLLSYTLKR